MRLPLRTLADRTATGFVAAVVEAWHELRIHKLRVLLSLVGVMVAVAALTAAVAASAIAKQAITEGYEQEGRPATLGVFAFEPRRGSTPSPALVRPALATAAERLSISYWSMSAQPAQLNAASNGLSRRVDLQVVDPPFAVMHRLITTQGRWLETEDARNLSPAVVVNERVLAKLGLSGRQLPVTLDLSVAGATPVTATVVGTVARGGYGGQYSMFTLADTYDRWFGAAAPIQDAQYQMWVPTRAARELAFEVRRTLAAELPGFQVEASRMDYLAQGGGDPLKEVRIVVSAIAGVILLLGILSLLNVALVTIQQRVREVGIRRSFGATTGRVFFSVMMESVVATVVAGVAGVMLAIALLTNPWVSHRLLDGVDDVPAFPLGAALLGLAVSVGVGALAGVLPALVAARVKIVDAIRF